MTTKMASIGQYISTIAALVELRTGYRYIQSKLLKTYKVRQQDYDGPKKPRVPVNKDVIKEIVDNSTVDEAVSLAIQCAFEGLLRVSDYAKKPKHKAPKLKRKHLRFDEALDGFVIALPWEKTSNVGQGHDVPFARREDDSYCLVARMKAYLRWRDTYYGQDDSLFIQRSGKPVMEYQINVVLKEHAWMVGASPTQVSSHSLRVGGACEMKDAGATWTDIIIRGRWRGQSAKQLAMYYARYSVARAKKAAECFRVSGGAAAAVPLIPTLRH